MIQEYGFACTVSCCVIINCVELVYTYHILFSLQYDVEVFADFNET